MVEITDEQPTVCADCGARSYEVERWTTYLGDDYCPDHEKGNDLTC